MAFRFPLATIMRLRQSLERREELALKTISAEVAQCKQNIEQLTAEIVEANKAREKTLLQATPAFQLQSMLSEVQQTADARRLLADSLVSLEQSRMKQLVAYRAAIRDRQILSDLEGRQRKEYELERDRLQQKQIDDIFAARAHRS
jgi:flagellar export protein FliJ